MAALLAWWVNIKKYKHGKHCHDKWKHFYLFVLSVGGMLGMEAIFLLAQLSRNMATQMDKPISHISHVRCWINGRIAIAVAIS